MASEVENWEKIESKIGKNNHFMQKHYFGYKNNTLLKETKYI